MGLKLIPQLYISSLETILIKLSIYHIISIFLNYIYLSIYLFMYLYMYHFIYVSLYLTIFLFLYNSIYLSSSIFLFIFASIHLSIIHISMYSSIYLLIYRSIHLILYLTSFAVYLSFHLLKNSRFFFKIEKKNILLSTIPTPPKKIDQSLKEF